MARCYPVWAPRSSSSTPRGPSRCSARLFSPHPGSSALLIYQLASASLSWGGDTLQAPDGVLSADGMRLLRHCCHQDCTSQSSGIQLQATANQTQLPLHCCSPTTTHPPPRRQATPRVVASALPRTVLFSQPRSRRMIKPGGSPRASVPQQEVTNTATGKKAAGPW